MYNKLKLLCTTIILSATSDAWSLSPPQPGASGVYNASCPISTGPEIDSRGAGLKSQDTLSSVGVELTNRDESHTLVVRRGVSDLSEGLETNLTAKIALDQEKLRRVVSGNLKWADTVDSGAIKIQFGESGFRQFLI